MPKKEAAASTEDKRWRAESDLSTLVEAAKIRGDAARLKAAMAMRDERLSALKSLEGKESK